MRVQCRHGKKKVKVVDEFGMSRRHVQQPRGAQLCADEDDSKTLQRRPHNDSACGRHEALRVARGIDARVCQDQVGKAPLVPLTGRSASGGTGRGVPSDRAKGNTATAAKVSRAADARYVTA